jgi:hypothetical protein
MRSGTLVVFVVALLLAIGCTGGDLSPSPVSTPSPAAESLTPTTTPTLMATSTVAAETGDMDGFRAYAPQIAEAVAAGDTAFFADRGLEEEVVCAGDEAIGPCYGQPADTVLRGIPGAVAESDAFMIFPVAEYPEVLRDWFTSASPDGSPTLHAIAHRPGGEDSDEAYQAIVTGVIVVGPAGATVLRQQGRIFDFQFVDGRWRLTGELYASLPETIRPWRYGDCDECYDQWERWTGATR